MIEPLRWGSLNWLGFLWRKTNCHGVSAEPQKPITSLSCSLPARTQDEAYDSLLPDSQDSTKTTRYHQDECFLCRCYTSFKRSVQMWRQVSTYFYDQFSKTLQSKHCMLFSLIVFQDRAVVPGTSNSSFISKRPRRTNKQTDPGVASTQLPSRPPKSQTFPFLTSLRAAWDLLRGP